MSRFGALGMLVLLLLAGCSQNYSDKKVDEALTENGLQAKPRAAGPAQDLPAGHPPLASATSTGAGAALAVPGQRQSLGGISVEMPEGWRSQAPTSSMRLAEYVLPGAPSGAGDATLVVFYFGPSQGGSVEANLERWYGQFEQPDGRPSKDRARRWEKKVGGIPVTLVEVKGTYSGGMGMGPAQATSPGYEMLGAIVGSPNGYFYFKLVGPEATVGSWTASFDRFVDSVRPE